MFSENKKGSRRKSERDEMICRRKWDESTNPTLSCCPCPGCRWGVDPARPCKSSVKWNLFPSQRRHNQEPSVNCRTPQRREKEQREATSILSNSSQNNTGVRTHAHPHAHMFMYRLRNTTLPVINTLIPTSNILNIYIAPSHRRWQTVVLYCCLHCCGSKMHFKLAEAETITEAVTDVLKPLTQTGCVP